MYPGIGKSLSDSPGSGATAVGTAIISHREITTERVADDERVCIPREAASRAPLRESNPPSQRERLVSGIDKTYQLVAAALQRCAPPQRRPALFEVRPIPAG